MLSGQTRLNGSDLAPLHVRGEAGWAALKIRPKSQFQIRNSFSFSNLFYKLQMNLNSNQI
jgi:hypothetical protein